MEQVSRRSFTLSNQNPVTLSRVCRIPHFSTSSRCVMLWWKNLGFGDSGIVHGFGETAFDLNWVKLHDIKVELKKQLGISVKLSVDSVWFMCVCLVNPTPATTHLQLATPTILHKRSFSHRAKRAKWQQNEISLKVILTLILSTLIKDKLKTNHRKVSGLTSKARLPTLNPGDHEDQKLLCWIVLSVSETVVQTSLHPVWRCAGKTGPHVV